MYAICTPYSCLIFNGLWLGVVYPVSATKIDILLKINPLYSVQIKCLVVAFIQTEKVNNDYKKKKVAARHV